MAKNQYLFQEIYVFWKLLVGVLSQASCFRILKMSLRKHWLNLPITQQIWYNRKKAKKQEEKRNEPDDIQRLWIQLEKAENEAGRMGRICTPVLPKRQAWQTNKRNRKNAADVSCCRSGSISLTRVWKMPSMTAMHSGNSWISTLWRNRFRMQQHFWKSVICWKKTIYGKCFSRRSIVWWKTLGISCTAVYTRDIFQRD